MSRRNHHQRQTRSGSNLRFGKSYEAIKLIGSINAQPFVAAKMQLIEKENQVNLIITAFLS